METLPEFWGIYSKVFNSDESDVFLYAEGDDYLDL